jgi:hypothetical protein
MATRHQKAASAGMFMRRRAASGACNLRTHLYYYIKGVDGILKHKILIRLFSGTHD